jgi:hypothetical protein
MHGLVAHEHWHTTQGQVTVTTASGYGEDCWRLLEAAMVGNYNCNSCEAFTEPYCTVT